MTFDDLLRRLKIYLETNQFVTFYELGKEMASSNEVLIGIGSESKGGVLLNNKLYGASSVSQYIMEQSEETIQIWRSCLSNPEQPELSSYYIEDLSADTCLAFILFVARILHVPVNEVPIEWLIYIKRWKDGDVRTTGGPFQSWGALLNALSHDYYEFEGQKKRYNTEKIQEGFRISLLFTIDLLLGHHSPSNVPSLTESEGYHRATAILTIEKQEYQSLLKTSAEKIQLELPLRHSKRKVLIDCLVATEINPLGTLKNFSRVDTSNPFFKSGFGLMALHRPHLQGTGDDMSISVDPVTGTHLNDLWLYLEELENTRWEDKRPVDPPRKNYDFNQPWFNGYQSTLLGAPKFITKRDENDPDNFIVTDELGSKLKWEDVLKALWILYNPAKDLLVHPYENEDWNFETSQPIADTAVKINKTKRFLALKWSTQNSNVLITPTFQRYLVACLLKESGTVIGIENLPAESCFKFIEIPGGFALIHEDGVVFFDDWTKDDSKVKDYYNEFNILVDRYNTLIEKKEEISQQASQLMEQLDLKRKIRKEFIPISDRLAKLKMDLRTKLLDTMPSSKDLHLKLFREEIEKRWGLHSQLDELYQTLTEIESTLKNIVETRNNRILNFITIFGFPVALFAGIFQTTLFNFFGKWEWDGKSIFSFGCVTVLTYWGIRKFFDKDLDQNPSNQNNNMDQDN